MNQVVLLGDSIFDNALYVSAGASVIDHLRKELPPAWKATLLAQDSALTSQVLEQIRGLPPEATHLVVSCGGNDALNNSGLLHHGPANSFVEVLSELASIQERFQKDYREMLLDVRTYGKPVAVCTIYDAIPDLNRVERTGLCLFNDVILREAFRAKVPVIDLRFVCGSADDYSDVSSIEPSSIGGKKIASAISRVVTSDAFGREESRVFT
jgi:hypothetical protein